MNVFTFVFLVVVAALSARLIEVWMKRRDKRHESSDEELAATFEKIELLEERIRVLERIVTESRVDLKQKIDSL